MARLLEHVFPCGLKWCSYSASKCVFTEPGALMGHECSSSAAWRFLKESRAPGGRMDARGQGSLHSQASSRAKISVCPGVRTLFASVYPVLLHVLCYIPPSSPTHLRCSFRDFKEKMAERNTLSPQCDTATARLELTVMAQGTAASPHH